MMSDYDDDARFQLSVGAIRDRRSRIELIHRGECRLPANDVRVCRNPRRPVAAAEGERNSARSDPVGGITHLQVNVGLSAVARVPATSHRAPCADALPRLHLDAAMLQMRQQHKWAVGSHGDHHVISGEATGPEPGSLRLSQQVGHESDQGAPGLVVGFAIVDDFDSAGDWGEHRTSESDEDLWWLGEDQAAPRPRRRPAVLVDRHQVDRVGGSERIGAVARHPVGRAVLHAAGP